MAVRAGAGTSGVLVPKPCQDRVTCSGLAVRRLLPPDRHAGDDDALSSDGSRGDAGGYLYSDRSHPPIPPPDLYRRSRLAEGFFTELPRLFHREMDRYRWRRQI